MNGFHTPPKWYPAAAIPMLLVTLLCAFFSKRVFDIIELYRFGTVAMQTATQYSTKSSTVSALELPAFATNNKKPERLKRAGKKPILPTVVDDIPLDISGSPTTPQALSTVLG